MKIEAVIFDMDGVISDTQKLHAQIDSDLVGSYGVYISPDEVTEKYAGVNVRVVYEQLLENCNRSYDIDDLLERKRKLLTQAASRLVDEIPGSINLIRNLYHAGLKMAVASSSDHFYVETVIEKLGLRKYFQQLISGDMVSNGKPDPEIFLLAASKLGVQPRNCVVIEDGKNGMQAAKMAKMGCIGLVSSKEQEYPTKNLVLSLGEITLDYLNSLRVLPLRQKLFLAKSSY